MHNKFLSIAFFISTSTGTLPNNGKNNQKIRIKRTLSQREIAQN